MTEIDPIRGMAPDELDAKEKEFRKELFNLRYQLLAGRVEKPSRVREVRREIARIHTVRSEQRLKSNASAS